MSEKKKKNTPKNEINWRPFLYIAIAIVGTVVTLPITLGYANAFNWIFHQGAAPTDTGGIIPTAVPTLLAPTRTPQPWNAMTWLDSNAAQRLQDGYA